eukprot:8069597-Pyramimonas_sp.AAC.1
MFCFSFRGRGAWRTWSFPPARRGRRRVRGRRAGADVRAHPRPALEQLRLGLRKRIPRTEVSCSNNLLFDRVACSNYRVSCSNNLEPGCFNRLVPDILVSDIFVLFSRAAAAGGAGGEGGAQTLLMWGV